MRDTLRWWAKRPPSRAIGVGDLAPEFWRFAAPRGLAGALNTSQVWINTLFVGGLASTAEAAIYTAAFGAQCLFYALAAYGASLEGQKTAPGSAFIVHRLARVALMFIVMNKSAVDGLVAVATRQKVWR